MPGCSCETYVLETETLAEDKAMIEAAEEPTERECEDYLKACGWYRMFVGDGWIHPSCQAPHPLKDALKQQMKADETRLAFLAKHLKTNLF